MQYKKDKNINEGFVCPKENTGISLLKIIISLFWSLLALFAVFLSFKCNKGFEIWSFLAAIFFGPIYVMYILATSYKECFP